MVLYNIYNSDTLEKLIDTVQEMHNKITWNEKLLVGKLNNWFKWYLTKERVQHYTINSLLYITTMKEKYFRMYEKFISQLKLYTNAIRILSKGYFPISLLPPMKLKKILNKVKKAIQISNQDYNIVVKRLHWYYNRKLVIFAINEERNMIVQFPVFVQPHSSK